jgi:hypothetical protein
MQTASTGRRRHCAAITSGMIFRSRVSNGQRPHSLTWGRSSIHRLRSPRYSNRAANGVKLKTPDVRACVGHCFAAPTARGAPRPAAVRSPLRTGNCGLAAADFQDADEEGAVDRLEAQQNQRRRGDDDAHQILRPHGAESLRAPKTDGIDRETD